MAEAEDTTIECGFCCRRNEDLEKPKTLPCTHVHCLGCLTAYFEINHTTRCPVADCGQVVTDPLHTLPSHDIKVETDTKWCNACIDNGLGNQPAVIYCTQCQSKFCTKHEEYHDAIHRNHQRITMEEYKVQATKLEIRKCPEHKDQSYMMGCRFCLELICISCAPQMGTCNNGSAHKLMSLDELVADLVEEDIKVQMVAKEDMLERLFKITSKASCEYDNKTREMIELLRDTRDEQLSAIRVKYDKMEKELVEKRQISKIQIAEFMEENVLAKWTHLRNQRNQIETKLKHSHQVDIVKGFNEMKEKIEQLMEGELPKLELDCLADLKTKGKCRSTEVELVSADGLVIDIKHGLMTSVRVPNSLHPVASVQLSADPLSIFHYKGSTYVGLSKLVVRIDSDYHLHESFISCEGTVESIVIHEDKVYLFVYVTGTSRHISVYDVSGSKITQWGVSFNSNSVLNVLSVVSDQLVIADVQNKRITVYSLSGQVLRHVPCTLLGSGNVCLCALDNDFVVISDQTTSQIFKINITSGETAWISKEVNQPMGISSCGRMHVLVSDQTKTIKVLQSLTGKVEREITVDSLTEGTKYALTTFDNKLAVANAKQIRFLSAAVP